MKLKHFLVAEITFFCVIFAIIDVRLPVYHLVLLQSNCWLYIDILNSSFFYFLGTNALVFLDIPENLLADALLAVRFTDVMGPFWEPVEKLFALVTGLGIFDFFACPGGLVFDCVLSPALMFDNIDATVFGAGFWLPFGTAVEIADPLVVEDLGSFVVLI